MEGGRRDGMTREIEEDGDRRQAPGGACTCLPGMGDDGMSQRLPTATRRDEQVCLDPREVSRIL